MQFPLKLTFKAKRLAAHVRVIDAAGMPVYFFQQQALKVKDAAVIYRTEAKQEPVFEVATDSVLGFNAAYTITNADGTRVGTLTREGKASVLKASYNVSDTDGQPAFRIEADSAWANVLSSFFEQIPVVGTITGGFVKPTYSVTATGTAETIFTLSQAGRSGNVYTLEKTGDLEAESHDLVLASVTTMLFRELDAA